MHKIDSHPTFAQNNQNSNRAIRVHSIARSKIILELFVEENGRVDMENEALIFARCKQLETVKNVQKQCAPFDEIADCTRVCDTPRNFFASLSFAINAHTKTLSGCSFQ